MSRLGAQKTINNFSKGWVTEYSPLNFPANSLTTALNINIKRDGSIESRNTFTKLIDSKDISSQYSATDWEHIKTFHFPNDLGIVIAYLRTDTIKLQFFHRDTKASFFIMPTSPRVFRDLVSFDLAFLDDGFLFFLNEEYLTGPKKRDSQVYRCKIDKDGSVEISEELKDDLIRTVVRVPETGDDYNWTGSLDGSTAVTESSYIKDGARLYEQVTVVRNGQVLKELINVSNPNSIYPIEVQVDNKLRKYYKGSLRLREEPGGTIIWDKFGVYYTEEHISYPLEDQSSRLNYRDMYGLPYMYNNIENVLDESVRYPNTSSFMSYNLYNAGWRWGEKVKFAGDHKGDTTSSGVGSLAFATKSTVLVWPCLHDSPDENKIDKANNVQALGLFSPFLLDSDQPLVGRTRRGSHVLSVTGEYSKNNRNPHNRAYFVPIFDEALSSVIENKTNIGLPLSNEFFQKALEIANKGGITAVGYINGRAWYGVEHESFNLAFSQIEERRVTSSLSTPGVGKLANCFQVADPNSPEANGLVATDGGTLSLRNLGVVKKIVEFRNYVLVFSTEGVWALYGANTGASFSPTEFSIDNISKRGITDNQNVVVTGDRIYYVSKDSIYVVTVDERGLLSVNNIANDTIKTGVRTLVNQFNREDRKVTSISYDYLEKKVYFNYNELKSNVSFSISLLGTLQGSADALVANGLTTLVFDETLGCFYKWKASSHNYSSYFSRGFGGLLPPGSNSVYLKDKGIEPFEPVGETRGSLGFFYTGNYGLFCIYEEFKVRAEEVTDVLLDRYVPYLTGNTLLYGSQLPEQGMYDSLTQSPTYPFDIQFSIPYEIFGEMSVDKSVTTASFYKDSTKSTRAGNNLLMTADWDTGGVTNPVNLHGNIRYPLNGSHVPRILTNKIKIPGSGNYLSLSFTNEDKIDEQGFNLLGYGFSVSMENRP